VDILSKIEEELRKAVVGLEEQIKLLTTCFLTGGHALIEGVPGIAKTTLTKNFANIFGMGFTRIQMTPDLLPADILGHTFYDMRSGEFKLRKGPIFTNVLLVDEINRASPKTQAALLEAMEERQVTIEGRTLKLPEPFIVLATRNPVEMEGVYILPMAQRDRFMMRIDMTYLPEKAEKELLRRKNFGDFSESRQIFTKETVLKIRWDAKKTYASDAIIEYIYGIVSETRRDERVLLGASPRAGEHLLFASKTLAYIKGRNYVIPDDVKELAVPVIAHRIVLKPEYEIENITPPQIIEEILKRTEVPTE